MYIKYSNYHFYIKYNIINSTLFGYIIYEYLFSRVISALYLFIYLFICIYEYTIHLRVFTLYSANIDYRTIIFTTRYTRIYYSILLIILVARVENV